MDCHATTTALARNDNKNGISKKVDSRLFDSNAQSVSQQQAAGFAMRNVGCKENRKGATLAVVTAAIFRRSRFYRAKPTPKPKTIAQAQL